MKVGEKLKVLLICNYQREIPPFMITMVKYAEGYYDKIEYVNPTLDNDNTHFILSDKVSFRAISRKTTIHRLFNTFRGLFRREVLKDVKKALQGKRIKKELFLHILSEVYPAELLYQEMDKLIKTRYKYDDVSALATWFNCNAYAVARIKRKYSYVTAASFAHAFEVNPERGEYNDLSLNEFKHTTLDRVSFISENVLKSYKALMGYSKEVFLGKIDVCYLGSTNRDDYICQCGDKTLHLLSCSGLSSVKRVDLILDALESWKEYPIEWTHIGSGDLYEMFIERAESINRNNPKVSIRFIGKLENQKVHSYYRENPIDLFINVSVSEGLPVSIMEAISYGVPIIATDVGGTSEIVIPPYNGYLLKSDLTYMDIQHTLKKYIELPMESKECMRKQSKEIWKRKFDSDINLPMYFKKLSSMTQRGIKDK